MRTDRPADPRPLARDYPSAAETMGMVLHSILLDALDADAERLARVNRLVESLGGERVQAADFLSYLLFEPQYTTTLMELGYGDARAARDRVARFLVPVADVG